MAFFSDVYTVGTVTAVQIVPPEVSPQHVTIHNQQKSSNHYFYLGGSAGITPTTAAHLDNAETRTFIIPPGNEMWALAGGNNYVIGVTRMFY